MTYTIPSYRKDKLLKKLEKFNKKALKFKALPIIYTVSDIYSKTFEKIIPITDPIEIACFGENTKIIHFDVDVVDIDMDIDSFKPIKGFKFLASIEHTKNGNIYSKVTPDVEIPKKYRTGGTYCDHCKTDRFRKNTFIVYNEKKKTFVQVGSTCIRDYLGVSVDLIAKRFEFLEELNMFADCEHDGFFKYQVPVWPLDRFLAVTINVIELDGYVSGKMAWESEGTKTATGRQVTDVLDFVHHTDSTSYRDWKRARLSFSDYQYKEALTIIEWFKSQPTDQDYYHNISVITQNNSVSHKTANTVASMVVVYRKAMDLLKPKDTRVSEWVGKPGDKMVLILTVKSIRYIENQFQYGKYSADSIQVCTMKDENGNLFTWFNSGNKGLEENKTYVGKATIKKHNEYKGVKLTVITRFSPKEI